VVFLNPEKSNLRKFLVSKNYKKVAILGGGKVYDFCLKHEMIDELFVTIEPYVFRNGVSMFAGKEFMKHKFFLESTKRLNKNGTLLLKYKNAN
jgi:dihydrofolate reductase